MAMTIGRTAMTDDDGTGTTGTIFNNAWKTALYDEIDALFATGGAWTSYSPTWTNLSVGNGTVVANYLKIGKLVVGEVILVWGSTTSISSSGVLFTLPANNGALTSAETLGTVGMLDASAASKYSGLAFVNSSTTGVIYGTASPNVLISATSPFVWTTSDALTVRLSYRWA